LFFISQKEKGLRTMKDVMKKRSTSDDDGVPRSLLVRYGKQPKQLNLFKCSRHTIKRLHDDLLDGFLVER